MRISKRIEAAEKQIGLSGLGMRSVFLRFFSLNESGPVMAWALSSNGDPIVRRRRNESDEDFDNRAIAVARNMGNQGAQGVLLFFEVTD